MAQTWGGCQKNTIAKSRRPGIPTLPFTAASAISGAAAPAAPPTTAFQEDVEFTSGNLHWSEASPGKSGYFYFGSFPAEGPRWEFAASDHADIKAFDGKPLKARFFGRSSPSRDKRLGLSSTSAISVEVGQVVLARTVQDPTTIYILKIENQEQNESMTVHYIVLRAS